MKSSANLKVSTHYEQSEWENSSSLWRSPSSPPYSQAQIKLFSPSNKKSSDSCASSPSTPSEFEFDSISSLQIRDDPPASPKLISSSTTTTEYWPAVPSFAGRAAAPVINHKVVPLSHPNTSPKQPSAPPSPSVRQLMAEEMRGENYFDLDFYSAPQTPTLPRKSRPLDSNKQRALSQDDEPTLSIVTAGHGGQRKSKSAVLERRAPFELAQLATMQENQVLQSSKSEAHGGYLNATSSPYAWEKKEEDKSGVKKQGSKSFKKWAFKDILRRTVPSSKADSHFITKSMGANSPKNYLSFSQSTPTPPSPPRSHMHHQPINSTPPSTLPAARPSTPGRSPPPHHRPSTPSRTPAHTPGSSPSRSPLSPHAVHYQHQKAQTQDLSRRTFLPYRQSLLGCLGGPGAFPPEQHVW